MKRILSAMMAVAAVAMIMIGGQTIAFAADESSIPDTNAVVSESGTDVNAAGESHPISENEGNNHINAAPNTGIGIAPIVAAALMVGSVPIIVKTSKKK